MDGGLDDEWEDASFLDELFRAQDEAVASRNPNLTPTPAPASAPIPTRDPFASAPISYLPAPAAAAASVSYLPAASYLSPALRFSPPQELTQRPPLPPPLAAAGDGDALAMVGGGFSPPRELSQRPAAEESDCAIVGVSGPVCGDRFMGTKREREAREVERLKRELNRVSKQMNDLKNECTELRKDRTRKDLQIKAKEVEIQNLKKANVGFAGKDICGTGMDIDQSVHVPANGVLLAVDSRASTRTFKSNGKVKEANSLWEDLCLQQRPQTDLPEALELNHRTMIDNTTSTSGGASLEESAHLEPRSMKYKEIKMIGVHTDNTLDSEHLDFKKVLAEHISSNLRAVWGVPTNSLSGRNLISKIIVSCSEEILALLYCTRLMDKCGTSSEASSSMNEAISQVYDMFIKMSSEKIPIQTFLEALLNLCSFGNAGIVSRTLRILHRILQHLLNYGTKSNKRNNVSVEPYVGIHMGNNHKDSSSLLSTPDAETLLRLHDMSLPFTFWSSVFTPMLQIGVKHSEESIRVDALSIMILIVRTTDPKEERQKLEFTSVMERLHRLLQKENGLLVKKYSVRLLFLLLNCLDNDSPKVEPDCNCTSAHCSWLFKLVVVISEMFLRSCKKASTL
uniref:Uncharacterized protein n=1 Tax=Arundo donax TaxID=35708 RepID=A0A0A9E0P4_ARUDO